MKSAVTLGLVGTAAATPLSTLFEIVEAQDTLSTLEAVLNQEGNNQGCFGELKTALSNADATLTAFAPNNEAWVNFQNDTNIDCTSNVENTATACCNVIKYHVLGEPVDFATNSEKSGPYTTLNTENAKLGQDIGQNLFASVGNELSLKWGLSSASAVAKNVAASNGFANIIDKVLYPLPNTVTGTASDASLTSLKTNVEKIMGLAGTLDDTEKLTVFAPTNDAFAKLILLDNLSDADLEKVLQTHVVNAVAFSTDLPVNDVATLSTQKITVADGKIKMDGNDAAELSGPLDVITQNGVVHVIDTVLIPAAVRKELNLPSNLGLLADTSRFYEILDSDKNTYGDVVNALADENKEKTVFAPSDEAFEALETNGFSCTGTPANKAVCLSYFYYHVVPGDNVMAGDLENELFMSFANNETAPGSVNLMKDKGQKLKISVADGVAKVNDATIIKTDYVTKSGVIHVIDTVLGLPGSTSSVAKASADLETLVVALTNTDLVDAVDSTQAITIFAPVDTAFDTLKKDFMTTFNKCVSEVKAELEECADILKYHVIASGAVYAADIADGNTDIVTLSGESITITKDANGVSIKAKQSTAKVTTTDILVKNGVVHLIDTVLLPVAGEAGEPDAAAAAQVTAAAVCVVAIVSALLA